MNRTTPLLILSVAIAAASAATACHRNDDQAAADASAAAAMPAAATTPPPMDASAGAMGPASDMAGGNAPAGPITDTDFYRQALDGGRKEVAAATLASTASSDAGVKAFAGMLVKDHTALDQQVATASGQSGAAATAPDASATAGLQGKTGADFDRAFVDRMVADHQGAIALFENAAQNASTEQAKSLAQGALPKLRAHLQAAQDLQGKLGGGTGAPGT